MRNADQSRIVVKSWLNSFELILSREEYFETRRRQRQISLSEWLKNHLFCKYMHRRFIAPNLNHYG